MWALDLARTAAILGMALYHFTYDLAFFGFIEPHVPFSFGWILEARIVATSFLGLAGASLVLAHGRAIRWRHFLRRFGWLVAAAAAISLSTWFDDPERYVFFGILHCIAAASLIGLVLLRLPAVLTLAAAVGVLAIWLYLPRVGFDANYLLGLGLSREVPRSMDFVPLVPWLAPYLAGMGIAQLLRGRARGTANGPAAPRPAPAAQSRLQRVLAWPGRHSLVIYVVHQPLLLGLTWAAAQLLR
ncbi:heparan-alpha-glucosaminide N-acetyltransferase [Phaeovulum sp. W22_SRMD_FR3]|uniref:heparan-alpha-glucosaminide N-acetyltransferase n=1 Tax=Phaeovulum sp. W22_SRMD_FR3 TaxID=3240274 RepID=UPI003F944728